MSINYTNCIRDAPEVDANLNASSPAQLVNVPDGRFSWSFKKSLNTKPKWGRSNEDFTWPISGHTTPSDVCILEFTIPNDISPPILFYYRLTNFYQNHRRYVKSVDIDQLKGVAKSKSDINSGDCEPLKLDPVTGRPYYPCGLIANSMFNDTFGNFTYLSANNDEASSYNFSTEGTSWAHEGDLYGKTKYNVEDVAVPPFWVKQWPDGKYTHLPDLHTWEQFQVWMRTAGLPTFSKLAQKNDNTVLKEGTYRLKIYDSMLCSTGDGSPCLTIVQTSQFILTAVTSQSSSRRALSWVARTHSLALPTSLLAAFASYLELCSLPLISSNQGQSPTSLTETTQGLTKLTENLAIIPT